MEIQVIKPLYSFIKEDKRRVRKVQEGGLHDGDGKDRSGKRCYMMERGVEGEGRWVR